MPAEQIGPEQFLRDVEDHSPQHRSPQRSAPSHDRHQDHPDPERGAGERGVERIDEADEVAVGAAGDGQEERGDRPRHDLAADGRQAHRLGLVLVVADGVEQQAEPAAVQDLQHDEADDRHGQEVEGEEPVVAAERLREQRRHHPGAGAEPLDAAHDLAGGDAESQGADGEVVAAQPQHAAAEQHRQSDRHQRRDRHAERQAAQIFARLQPGGGAGRLRVAIGAERKRALHDRAGVHAGAEEQHVAERVVPHLAADDVPGERQHHQHPQHRHLRLELRRHERPGHAGRRQHQRPHAPQGHRSTWRRRLRR